MGGQGEGLSFPLALWCLLWVMLEPWGVLWVPGGSSKSHPHPGSTCEPASLRSVLLSLLVASGPGVERNDLEPGPELCFPDPSLIGRTKNSRPRPHSFDALAGAVGNKTCSEEL